MEKKSTARARFESLVAAAAKYLNHAEDLAEQHGWESAEQDLFDIRVELARIMNRSLSESPAGRSGKLLSRSKRPVA